jgi:L-cysteine S-thiosulfotransferase
VRINLFAIPLILLAAPLAAEDRVAMGKQLAFERSKGNCLACHRIADGELPGTLGPPLMAMKLRYPDRAALEQQICDATLGNPDTRMPPFCRHGILTEDEVDLIVEYLYTL